MKRRSRTLGIVISLLAKPATAQESFDCKELSNQELRVYRGLSSPTNKVSTSKVKVKKGAIVVDEQRGLLTDWFKPEGSLGSVIPYKQSQILFSKYLIEGRERICSSQRHEEVFGAGETGQQYQLRCLIDADGNARFEAFHRYGELVSYDMRSGKQGAPTGALQVEQPLAQPFHLVIAEATVSSTNEIAPALRSVIRISDVTKGGITLRLTSRTALMEFEANRRYKDDGTLSWKVEMPLNDGAIAFIGGTKMIITRSKSGWDIATVQGFFNESELICGGTVLTTREAITVFGSGGMQVYRRTPLAN